ncbi:MAG TPA: hypothetical protein VGD73_14030 [Pseudonocardia sp.]|uniref:hypothetical protein n=1 Tax=Pseudonocardia sp. TaxID=60912 RepID=UPI002ED954FB
MDLLDRADEDLDLPDELLDDLPALDLEDLEDLLDSLPEDFLADRLDSLPDELDDLLEDCALEVPLDLLLEPFGLWAEVPREAALEEALPAALPDD